MLTLDNSLKPRTNCRWCGWDDWRHEIKNKNWFCNRCYPVGGPAFSTPQWYRYVISIRRPEEECPPGFLNEISEKFYAEKDNVPLGGGETS